MPDKKINVGIIGAGHFVRGVLLPNTQKIRDFQVVGICSKTLSQAEIIADDYGIGSASANWQEFINREDVDALFIAVPPFVQEKIIHEICGRKHILAEKPFSANLEYAVKNAEKALAASTINMIDFCFPELKTWQTLKSIIDQKELGRVQQVIVNWSFENYVNMQMADSWKSSPQMGGGTLCSFMSHVFYYLEWFLGPVKKLMAHLLKAPDDLRKTDTLNIVTLEFESGVIGNIAVNAKAWQGQGHRIEFYGEKGTAILKNEEKTYMKGFKLLHYDKNSEKTQTWDDFEIEESQPNYKILKRCSQAILGNNCGKPDFQDGLRVQILIDCAMRSSINSEWVSTPSEVNSNNA